MQHECSLLGAWLRVVGLEEGSLLQGVGISIPRI